MGLENIAGNALECLEINGPENKGHELVVIYDGDNKFKTEFAEEVAQKARNSSISVKLVDTDKLLREIPESEDAVSRIIEETRYSASSPLQRNAMVLLGINERNRSRLKGITQKLLGQQAYVLTMPCDQPETARALLTVNANDAERTALAMKNILESATHYRVTSGNGEHALEWKVNPGMKWVPSVGKPKRYSPTGPGGKPIGGWGNPAGEVFTSFAPNLEGYLGINGSLYIDGFTRNHALEEGQEFVLPIRNGAIDLSEFRRINPDTELVRNLAEGFGDGNYAKYLGEFGVGIIPGIYLGKATEPLSLEKIGGTVHFAPGYDECDRGTGGFITTELCKQHNDCGIRRPRFEALIPESGWNEIVSEGTSPYFVKN